MATPKSSQLGNSILCSAQIISFAVCPRDWFSLCVCSTGLAIGKLHRLQMCVVSVHLWSFYLWATLPLLCLFTPNGTFSVLSLEICACVDSTGTREWWSCLLGSLHCRKLPNSTIWGMQIRCQTFTRKENNPQHRMLIQSQMNNSK